MQNVEIKNVKPLLQQHDVSGSALVDVKDGVIKLPKDCGIVTTIVYDHYKFAKVVEVSPNYDFFMLEFWQEDNPKQVIVNWITPFDYKSRYTDSVEHHYR